ncbi:hypothetical protein IAQ61_005538 [Plenodomus lingam]|uniref:ribonuclease T1 n=1 Tax=Leptosphaeria maculans (strain JN3 / isolate v23.1.3 / race Av1-4-5-6-7-8) TaxID=985895 RepID=E4ZYS1_LEPMJ|nr:hypothetical protein LEMA_P108620.1 [Plenodomus lingam JN3]KAH9871359.1 hypothetical protein IAQ61_005538 [Plenodomus lingam]CBX96597.1 hypothetical protein LEMA_P108620.1 [Plenodomus lingam JN3]
MHFPTPLLLLLTTPFTLAAALPTSSSALETRQSCAIRCGSTCYTAAQASAARTAGHNHYLQDTQAGSSNYPHTYNNREGFDFLVAGPYQEFPLRTSGVYTGGSPGADRVVFNTQGERAGEITHTGAQGSNFVACTGW